MFRRQAETLEADPTYPANLEELGYFVDKVGCIRKIKTPELYYNFHWSNNERHNEVRGEAMRVCQREGVLDRLSALGLNQLYYPNLTDTKPDGPHVPIVLPAAEVLRTRKRVVILINDDVNQDLGVLAYRLLQREGGFNGGSIVDFVKKLIARNNPDANVEEKLSADEARVQSDDAIPGLIITNTSQLYYSHKFNKACNIRSWNAMPRKSIYHEPVMVHPEENHLEGHSTPEEHLKTFFDTVVKNPAYVAPDAEVYILAIENGASSIMNVLNNEFWKYGDRITAMAIFGTSFNASQVSESALKAFLHTRAREWKLPNGTSTNPSTLINLPRDYKVTPSRPVSRKVVNWLEKATEQSVDHQADAHERFQKSGYNVSQQSDKSDESDDIWHGEEALCPTFAGGDTIAAECIFTQPEVQDIVLNFFEDVAQDPKNYTNPSFTLELDIPQPTPDAPLELDPAFAPPPGSIPDDMLTEEQQELKIAQAVLDAMQVALSSTPSTNATLRDSSERLSKRIQQKEIELEELERKALASGGLGSSTAEQVREKWENKAKSEKWTEKKTGPAIMFAGVEVDSETVKGAGCPDTVAEELKNLDVEDD
ncbi:hypothetical protein CC80DRAFT_16024 [Byssothecium circinans]|uniref:Arb2 domain-containing protein n=1 Tax=Byssothecium circinans TaxID=147558 RepID=A0A6A5U130_9PLEO|nr:hypothetical protein CC80DRAFT_16024 [Byssothecium circinans]